MNCGHEKTKTNNLFTERINRAYEFDFGETKCGKGER